MPSCWPEKWRSWVASRAHAEWNSPVCHKETVLEKFLLVMHVVICLVLVVLVLLQSGKEGMGVIFGGGSSSLFGSSGAGGMLAKITAFVAVAFVVTSLGYNLLTTERKPAKSVMESVTIEDVAPGKAAPAQTAPAQAVPAPQQNASQPAQAPKQ